MGDWLEGNCCSCHNELVLLNTLLTDCKKVLCSLESIVCEIQNVGCNTSDLSETEYKIYASLASRNPMAVAAEYPTTEENHVTFSTGRVLFSDMLNPYMAVLFKQPTRDNLPVYFKDQSSYEHIVTIGDTSTQAVDSNLVNNYPYQALYVGNYIILNPTEETLEKFKNGELN